MLRVCFLLAVVLSVPASGAAGEQQKFLSKEDYKTLKERERIVAEGDLKGQQEMFKGERVKSRGKSKVSSPASRGEDQKGGDWA